MYFLKKKLAKNRKIQYNQSHIERGSTMNKEELVQEVAKKAKVTQKEAVEVLN
ncbi:TPA: hypothetical protein IAA82_06270, partial [Candidatus Galligastranaerophilus gallistercoris]|nr:hypothetical protein [Candidatus Galligastranaerophilus gallistercoris]